MYQLLVLTNSIEGSDARGTVLIHVKSVVLIVSYSESFEGCLWWWQDPVLGAYVYKHSDLRPWDPRTDLFQYEHNYVIATKTRHKAPMIRTASIVSVDPKCDVSVSIGHVNK